MNTKPLRVGIQGIKGSFHQMAADAYFSQQPIELVCLENFRALFHSLKDGRSDVIVCAIENTLAGSLLPNYSLLEHHGFFVIGELYLPIEQCIMALPGATLHSLEQVWSHPIALLQCEEFLSEYPHIQPVEMRDTADCARRIAEGRFKHIGAIAARGAAALFGLNILAANIQTHKNNFTRFLVIAPSAGGLVEQPNKASVSLQLADRPGTLLEVLEICKKYQINLTKIQSIPIIGRPYTYSFHFDMEWPTGTDYVAFFEAVKPKTENFHLLGVYRKGYRYGF
jgi:prephenate dehydratase